jgi:hypothetical protein
MYLQDVVAGTSRRDAVAERKEASLARALTGRGFSQLRNSSVEQLRIAYNVHPTIERTQSSARGIDMPIKKTKKKSSARTKRKTKTKASPVDRDQVLVEETTRVERVPVVVRREPATLARALAQGVVIETTEPEVEKTVIRKHRRRVA